MAEPITNVLGIVSIKNRGEYNSETSYEKLNVVTYQGSSYCALRDTIGNLPTNTDYWQLYAEKGAKGDTGATGAIGPIGPKGDPSGAPLAAANVSDMTDTNKIYVNTTDGNWYYYNGNSWQKGGVYQATQIGNNQITPNNFAYFLNSILYNTITVEDNTRISGYDPSTHKINRISSNQWITYKINITNMNNEIKFSDSYDVGTQHGNHTVCTITTNDETVIQGFAYNANSNITGINYTSENRFLECSINDVKLTYNNVKYIFICFFKENAVNILSNSILNVPLWFGINTQNDLNELNEKINKINYVNIDIMPRITALVGHEINFYKDAILHTHNNEQYDLKIGIPGLNGNYVNGHNYGNVYRFTPTINDVGERNCTIFAVDKITQQTVQQKTFTLNIIKDNIPYTKVMFIGDSLTEAGYYPAEIIHNLSNKITSIGTLSTTVTLNNEQLTTPHEGRAGWSAIDYVSHYETKNHTNAFWNPSTNKFDFSYYMKQNGFTDIDVVYLNLGTNEVDKTQENINALNEMITSIHNYSPSIKILISLINLGALQTGWGTRGSSQSSKFNYDVVKLHDAVKDNLLTLPNVYVTAPYVNLDCVNDFATVNVPASSRNPKIITIENNTVHPSVYGYLKLADIYYNELVYYMNN